MRGGRAGDCGGTGGGGGGEMRGDVSQLGRVEIGSSHLCHL